MSGRSFVTHLEAAIDGTHLPARSLQTMHDQRPLLVRYDLDAVRSAISRDDLDERELSLWRYRELLPFDDERSIVSLGETMSPLVPCPGLGAELGLDRLFIKDESRLPTGSFKSRGMAMAVTMAKQFGVTRVAAPTAGNAGGALAAYAARAGMECFVFMPRDTPIVNQYEAAMFGARVVLVNGLITDCGRIVREHADRFGWFDMSTLKEPYRIEGKKTMGLELAEQMNWTLPDAIFYPTGGGTGLIGMWKAFDELAALGWLAHEARPRMYACQSTGCAPIVSAFQRGERFAELVSDPQTIALGLRVPVAIGDFLILDAVRASGGRAIAGEESCVKHWMNRTGAIEGISLCPEAAICLDALQQAVQSGWVDRDDRVVVFNTGAAQKYVEAMRIELPVMSIEDDPARFVEIEEPA